MASWFRLALCASLICVWGCREHETLWLLDVSALESTTAEPGSTLEFSGRGFPSGRSGELVLRGTLRSAGVAEKETTITLATFATSSVRVNALVDERTARTLPSHASFDGRAQLRFASRDGGWIAGEISRVALEWRGIEDASDSGLRHGGEKLLAALGLEVNESVADSGSVRISNVHARSAGATAGVLVGDRIEWVNGLRVRSISDLAQPAGARTAQLMLRDAVDAPRAMVVSLERDATAAFEGFRYLLWVCPVALALLFLGPWPSPAELLQSVMHYARGHQYTLFRPIARACGSKVRARGLRDPRLETWGWVSLAAAMSCAAASAGGALSLGSALAGYGIVLAWRSVIASRSKTIRDRLHSVLPLATAFALVTFALACGAALGGGASFEHLGREQGGAPFGWALFSRPPTWIGAFIVVSCIGQLHASSAAARAVATLDNLGRTVLASIVTALWLGGAGTLEDLQPALGLGLGSATFAVKMFGVLCALAFVQPLAASAPRTQATAAGLLGFSTLVWLWVAPERAFELRLGCSVLSSACLSGAIVWAAHHRQRRIAPVPTADSAAGAS